VKAKKERFWKLARIDGFDFYTGKTINYRENIGKEVVCPKYDKNGDLCSGAFIHASRTPDQCFVGADIPCSVFRVEGMPIKEEGKKAGFGNLRIIKEYKPEKVFKWNYSEAVNPIHPFGNKPLKITDEHIQLLKKWDSVWGSVRYSVRYSVGGSIRYSVGNSVWGSVRYSVGNSVWDSVYAYIGSIFAPVVEKWKGVKHKKGEYPFQPAVDLWKMGLVSSCDGEKWRLHGGEKADILWEGKL